MQFHDQLKEKLESNLPAAASYIGTFCGTDDWQLQEILDETVIDALNEIASTAVNEGSSRESEAHDAADALASEINNNGMRYQIAMLLTIGYTLEQMDDLIGLTSSPDPC